jgi:hypothetical protein
VTQWILRRSFRIHCVTVSLCHGVTVSPLGSRAALGDTVTQWILRRSLKIHCVTVKKQGETGAIHSYTDTQCAWEPKDRSRYTDTGAATFSRFL